MSEFDAAIDDESEDGELELLQIVTCPFAEDLRDFQFPSLERWRPKEEKEEKTEEEIVDSLIDGFDLGELGSLAIVRAFGG